MKSNIVYEKLLVKRFDKKYKKFGKTIKSLGWDNSKNQRKRFENIFQISNLKKCKNILDVGCGFGDLFLFLKKYKIFLSYTGIDINENFIIINNKNKSLNKCVFDNKSIFDFKKKSDLIVSFGLLNYNKCSNKYVEYFIKECFKKSNKAVLIDFISDDQLNSRYKFINYHKPENIIKIIRKITKNYSLHSNYENIPQKEFTILLYK